MTGITLIPISVLLAIVEQITFLVNEELSSGEETIGTLSATSFGKLSNLGHFSLTILSVFRDISERIELNGTTY